MSSKLIVTIEQDGQPPEYRAVISRSFAGTPIFATSGHFTSARLCKRTVEDLVGEPLAWQKPPVEDGYTNAVADMRLHLDHWSDLADKCTVAAWKEKNKLL